MGTTNTKRTGQQGRVEGGGGHNGAVEGGEGGDKGWQHVVDDRGSRGEWDQHRAVGRGVALVGEGEDNGCWSTPTTHPVEMGHEELVDVLGELHKGGLVRRGVDLPVSQQKVWEAALAVGMWT